MISQTSNGTSSTERGLPSAFLFYRISSESFFLGLGMTCFFAWINMLFCFEGILRDDVAYEGGVVHDPLLLGATISASLFLALLTQRGYKFT